MIFHEGAMIQLREKSQNQILLNIIPFQYTKRLKCNAVQTLLQVFKTLSHYEYSMAVRELLVEPVRP